MTCAAVVMCLTEDDVRDLYSYKDFNGFLMAFKAVTERLRTPEDYEFITYRLMQSFASRTWCMLKFT